MAEGFQGVSLVSRKSTVIQTPIGFFGVSVSLTEVANLYITVVDEQGRPLRGTTVMAENTDSNDPRQKTTDQNGSVALVADGSTNIIVTNNKFSKTYTYNRTTQGNYIELIFSVPLIF